MPARLVPRLLLGLVVLALPLAACGGDKGGSSAPSDCTKVVGAKTTLVARNIQWNTSCLEVPKPETVAFTVKLEDEGVRHDLQIYGNGIKQQTDLQSGPVTQSLTVPFTTAGQYHFVCTIHSTMEGTLYVDGA